MNLLIHAWEWLTTASHWQGPTGIPTRILEHLTLSFAALAIAFLIAVPVGILIGHSGRGSTAVGAFTGAARSIPTLGILTIAGLVLGIGAGAPLVALVVLAIPSLLAGAYSGVESVERASIEGAQSIGMSPRQVILHVEIPLASPLIFGGIRAATLQVIATATLAAYTANLGLGRFLFSGLKTRDYPQMLAGALLVTTLALAAEIVLSALQRYASRKAHPRSKQARAPQASLPKHTEHEASPHSAHGARSHTATPADTRSIERKDPS
ncbi:ABC transporter permease [Arcanobacterium haemolyticum]|nr:ABC transporter permease [Arcanobacterium haemolyticum]